MAPARSRSRFPFGRECSGSPRQTQRRDSPNGEACAGVRQPQLKRVNANPAHSQDPGPFAINPIHDRRISAHAGVRTKTLAKLRWHGHDVFYRPGTSDPLVINQVLLRQGGKAEYYLPLALDPKVILDIGSNIGASVLYFHERFPSAKIYGFEPHPETFRILQANVDAIPSVEVFNYALGADRRQDFSRVRRHRF